MVSRFARPVPVLCMISNIVLNYIYDLHHQRITAWNQAILNPLALQQYADAVSDKGAALNNCFGFVDGTVRPICRPGEHQRMVYNGHKRVHALKFQAVGCWLPSLMALLDNCLDLWVRIRNEGFLFLIDSSSLVNFPYKLTSLSSEGKRHDAAMLADSNLLGTVCGIPNRTGNVHIWGPRLSSESKSHGPI